MTKDLIAEKSLTRRRVLLVMASAAGSAILAGCAQQQQPWRYGHTQQQQSTEPQQQPAEPQPQTPPPASNVVEECKKGAPGCDVDGTTKFKTPGSPGGAPDWGGAWWDVSSP